jgi:streptogramin lyase
VNPGGNNATTIRNDTDNNPMGMAFDGAGNLWVANFSEVGKISSPGGTNSETVFAGYGGGGHSNQLAIDSAGNVWIANSNGSASSLSELSNNGTPITGNSGYTGGGIIDQPAAIAIDGAGCIWTANSARGVSEFTNCGAALSPASGYTGGYGASGTSGYLGTVDAPVGIAIDGSGNVWIANQGNGTLTEFIGAGTPVITPIAAGLPSTPTTDGSSNLGTRP